MAEVRRFRRALVCGHVAYTTTLHGHPPEANGPLLCSECGAFSAIVGTTEVPAIQPRLNCGRCRREGTVRDVEDRDTDHPRVIYGDGEHVWAVQL